MRVGLPGREVPVVRIDDSSAVDVSSLVHDFDAQFFGTGGLGELRRHSRAGSLGGLPKVDLTSVRVGAPIARPGKIVCIGLNYVEHAAESNMTVPPEPVVFLKSGDTLSGPFDDVHIPRGSVAMDWEVELGVVIAEECRYLDRAEQALPRIAGVVVCNDLSERDFQLHRGGQWDKGKSCETFNPCGPWLATADELVSLSDLVLSLDVNGVRRQEASTHDMIVGVAELVHYVSQFMVLRPGDLLNTGTPPGVGMGMVPAQYLRPGDVVECGISGLGSQRFKCVPAP